MKKMIIKTSLLLLIIIGAFSCKNENWEFDDFDYWTTYFAYQYPVRTLVLGDYMYDNSEDNEYKFLIAATTGGGYENKKDIKVGFTVDNSLVDDLYTSTNTPIKALPSEWYTISNSSEMIIPKGEFFGGVTVQLTDKFFEDENALDTYWAIPIRMTSTTVDSILKGNPIFQGADPRIATEWTITPKDFTIFGIKYVNEWHGKYLLRGKSIIKDETGVVKNTVVYRPRYIEAGEVVNIFTTGRHQVKYSGPIRGVEGGSPGNFEMQLNYDANNHTSATITNVNTDFPVAGVVKMGKGAESWNNIARDVIYLDYTIKVGNDTHEVKDTLVFRDKAVKFEQFTPKIVKN